MDPLPPLRDSNRTGVGVASSGVGSTHLFGAAVDIAGIMKLPPGDTLIKRQWSWRDGRSRAIPRSGSKSLIERTEFAGTRNPNHPGRIDIIASVGQRRPALAQGKGHIFTGLSLLGVTGGGFPHLVRGAQEDADTKDDERADHGPPGKRDFGNPNWLLKRSLDGEQGGHCIQDGDMQLAD